MLQYNCNFELEGSTLGNELVKHKDEKNPQFNKEAIKEGFTYTLFEGKRSDGLVTRRNNELNLFWNGDYSYYDTKEKIIEAGIDSIEYP